MKKTLQSKTLVVAMISVAFQSLPLSAEDLPVDVQLESLRQLDVSSPKDARQFRRIVYDLAEKGQEGSVILQLAENIENEEFRHQTLINMVEDIADHEPDALLEWIQEDNERIKLYLDDDAVLPLAKAYPLEMIELAKKLCPLYPRPQPKTAADARLYERMKYFSDERCWFEDSVVQGAFVTLSKQNREAALEAAEFWADHEVYYATALRNIVSAWAAEDVDAAKGFVDKTITDQKLVNKLHVAIMESVGEEAFEKGELDVGNPEVAWQLIESRVDSEGPISVAKWIETNVADSENQLNCYRSLFRRWVMRGDRVEAMDWVDSRPKGKLRDELIKSVLLVSKARSMTDEEISKLLELASSIGEPDLIRSPMRIFLRGSNRSNAAREFIEESKILSERDKEKLRRDFAAIDNLRRLPARSPQESTSNTDSSDSKWRTELRAKSGISPEAYDAYVHVYEIQGGSEGLAKALVKNWFGNSDDPKEIAIWFKSQELDSGLIEVLQTFTYTWFRFDEDGAAAWVAAQEEGEFKTSMSVVVEAAQNRNGRVLHGILNKND